MAQKKAEEMVDTSVLKSPDLSPESAEKINLDIEPYKVKVRTIRAMPADLCGYQFDFKNKLVKQGSETVKVGETYILDSEKYVDKNPKSKRHGKTVLPEIVAKLVNNKMVEIVG
jgi:hypothetical protein